MITGRIFLKLMDMYKQGDLVIVRYPFSDNPKKSKIRPALIVSNEKSNNLDNDFLICPVTTSLRLNSFSFSINPEDCLSPLPEHSEIRCNKVVTMREHLILNKFSELNRTSLKKVLELIKSSF